MNTIKEPVVSVIVPAYNVEQYIERCLESILSQTYKDFELIVVDDGSTDRTQEILNHYHQTYDFQSFRTENHGLSAARNYGLERAQGKYVVFFDSDDYMADQFLEKLVKKAEEGNDVVVCDYYLANSRGNRLSVLKLDEKKNRKDLVAATRSVVWDKLFSRKLLQTYSLRFPDGYIFEDIPFTFEAMLRAKSIGYVREGLMYHLTDRSDSIMNDATRCDHHILEVVNRLNERVLNDACSQEDYEIIQEVNVRYLFGRLKDPRFYKHDVRYCVTLVHNVFELLNQKFPNWRKNSSYAKSMRKLYRHEAYWVIRIMRNQKK